MAVSGLNSLTVKNIKPVENTYTDDVFEGVKHETCTLSVPVGSKQAYSTSHTWKEFNIVEATPDAVEAVNSETPTVQNNESSIVLSNVSHHFNTVALYNLTGCKTCRSCNTFRQCPNRCNQHTFRSLRSYTLWS